MNDEYNKFELGNISKIDFLNSLLRNNINQKQIDIIENQPLLKFTLRKQTYEIAKLLKNRYNIFVLSNTNVIDFPALNRWLELDKIFQKCYLSYKRHLAKPSIEIYKDAEKYFGIEANETLFLDDKIENVLGAEKCGWEAVQIKNERSLINEFKKRKII